MYQCIISRETFQKVEAYLSKLKEGTESGKFLYSKLSGHDINDFEAEEFLEILVNTKRPQIFAESAVSGNGLDWNLEELSILGDLGIAVPVTIFDNGQHHFPDVHKEPFTGTLLYIPGALLNSCAETPADWDEVTENGRINQEAYTKLYERRLLPLFLYANEVAKQRSKKAFITIPGLGCGQFAGPFRGNLGISLRMALKTILSKHCNSLENIKGVYYDPYDECENYKYKFNQIICFVRPLTKGNYGKSQLSQPSEFNEESYDFKDCEFFSLVAWDHVSWPGNDFFTGGRITDDGVKAAATNSMAVMTGVQGVYDPNRFKYMHPENYSCWRDVVYQNDLSLEVYKNLLVY